MLKRELAAYPWPGNVRELANVIERAVVLGQGVDVALSDLPAQIVSNGAERSSDDLSYRHALEAAKRGIVIKALAHTNGNRAAAARVLGLHKTHLLDLIKSLELNEGQLRFPAAKIRKGTKRAYAIRPYSGHQEGR